MKIIIEWTMKAGTLLMVFGLVIAIVGMVLCLLSMAFEEVLL